MEDYARRYTPQRFRKWSEWGVANTAFGAASFLVLEAAGPRCWCSTAGQRAVGQPRHGAHDLSDA